MIRQILAVVTGFAVWTALWFATNAALKSARPEAYSEAGATSDTGLLILVLFLSVVFSVIAGFITASVASRNEMKPVVILAVIQVVIGIMVELSYWSLIPTWYHIAFVLLLAPAIIAGGKLAMRKKLKNYRA